MSDNETRANRKNKKAKPKALKKGKRKREKRDERKKRGEGKARAEDDAPRGPAAGSGPTAGSGASLTALMNELRADGAVDSQGNFTLDREQARAKMQKFQLVDARRYVLELVQAAVLRGATNIDFDIDADDMRVRFDGEVFALAEFDDLYGSLFGDGEGAKLDGLRQLAVALNAAMGMAPKFIEVQSGAARLTMRPGQEDEIGELDSALGETRIHVRQKLRPRVIFDFFRNLAGLLDEEQYLRMKCRYASIPIVLEGKTISFGLGFPDAALNMDFAGQGFRGAMGLSFGEDEPARLRLVKGGVWIDTHELDALGTNIEAVVECGALRKDVSQAKIVRDETVERVVACFRRARWQLWKRALECARAGSLEVNRFAVMARIRAQLLHFAEADELRVDEAARWLCERIRWTDARDSEHSYSLAELLALGEDGPIRYTVDRYPLLPREGPPIIELVEGDEGLHDLLDRGLMSAEDELARATRREQGRRAWLERRGRPVLPSHLTCLARARIDQPGLRGEVGVDTQITAAEGFEHPVHLLLYKPVEGGDSPAPAANPLPGLLGRLELDIDIPNVWMVLEASFETNDEYTSPALDGRFAEALLAGLRALHDPLAEAFELTETFGEVSPRVRGLIKRWLLALIDPGGRREMLEKVGFATEIIDAWAGETTELLPALRSDRLIAPPRSPDDPRALLAESPARIADVPLFLDVDGERVSLAELARRREDEGEIRYLPWADVGAGVDELRGVARLGVGDLRIVKAVFDNDGLTAVHEQLERLQLRQLYLEQEPVDLQAQLEEFRAVLREQGVDPDQWTRELSDGEGTKGHVVVLGDAEPFDERDFEDDDATGEEILGSFIELYVESRLLDHLDLGVPGMAMAAVESPKIRADANWAGAEDDEGLVQVCDLARGAAVAIIDGLADRFAEQPDAIKPWLGWLLLLTAKLRLDQAKTRRGHEELAGLLREQGVDARVRSSSGGDGWGLLARIRGLPILPTVDGGAISLKQAAEIVATHGKLEVVDEDQPAAKIDPPAIVQCGSRRREALEALLGAKLVDGHQRIRLAGVEAELAALPVMTKASLDDDAIWVRSIVHGGGLDGEVGLSRTRESGLHVVVGTAGHRVAELGAELPVPIDAAILDENLPLLPGAEIDRDSRHVRNLLRTCRRFRPELVLGLVRRFPALDEAEQAEAWALLVAHAADEFRRDEARRDSRERALRAVCELEQLRDVWGGRHSIAEIASLPQVDVLISKRPTMPAGESAETLGRIVLTLSPAELDCLEHRVECRVRDEVWGDLLRELERLRESPRLIVPDLDEVALIDRKAQVSGNLQALLWLPRDHRPLAGDPALEVIYAKGDREIARGPLLRLLPATGVVRGEGLASDLGEVELEDRQLASLERQVVVLYDNLIGAVGAGRLGAEDHERALEYLAIADFRLARAGREHPAVGRLGKRVDRLRAKLEGVVPPVLRQQLERAEAKPATKPKEAEEPKKIVESVEIVEAGEAEEPKKIVEAKGPDQRAAPEPEKAMAAKPDEASSPAPEQSPEQALLSEIHAELAWARARHGDLLDVLGLTRLSVDRCLGQDIAELSTRGIVIRVDHPIVVRLREQAPNFDPIDLSFVVAAVYSLMNAGAEEIDDDDEREFVAQLAEALVLAQRAQPA